MNKDQTPLYIGAFLFSILLFYWIGGYRATFYYLLLVFIGVLFNYMTKYKITVKTPEILQ